MVFLYVRLWKPTDGRGLLSLSICAASNENDAFVVHICPELVRVHRFRRPRAFVNFVIFWIIHKTIRWYLSLFIVNSLSFFLPSHLQNNRSSKVASFSNTVVSAPIVWYVSNACSLFYFTRSFVRSSSFGSKSFKQSSGKKKRIKIILSALSPFFFERLSKSNAFSQHESNQNLSLTNSFFAFVFSRLRRFSLKQQKKRRPTKIPQIRRHRRVVADGNLPNRRRRRGNRGRRHHFVRLHPHRFGARFRVIESWIHRRRHGLREKESILYIYSEVREKRKRTRTKIRERERRGKRQKWRKRGRERERVESSM